jgi:hypothetical protein
MRRSGAILGLLGVSIALLRGQSAPPVFRVAADAVAVNVSVKRGNIPVLGLAAEDFVLYDDDVRQRVAAVSIDAVPIDVSFVLDLSSSVASYEDAPRDAIERMVAFLRPADRFRVVTMEKSVVQGVPWQPAGPLDTSKIQPVPGLISLVTDSVLVALAHDVAPDRRHLIVAMTDGEDQCSLASGDTLRRIAERSGAVFHWVDMQPAPVLNLRTYYAHVRGVGAVCKNFARPVFIGKFLSDAARLTGGSVHTARLTEDVTGIVNSFNAILDDFRQSYILHYAPEGVSRTKWHRLRVNVQEKTYTGYTVRARPGYWGLEDVSGKR